jgi:thioredoxin-related protein
MKKIFSLLFLGIMIFQLSSCNKSEEKVNKFKVDPLPVIEDAIKNKKFLILIFESESCRFCTKLHKEVLDTFDFKQKLIKNNVAVAIINVYGNREVLDPETRRYMNEQILAYVYRVQSFPTIIFFDPENNYRKYAVIPGYIEKERFFNILDFIGSGCYKKIDYKKWLENGKKC